MFIGEAGQNLMHTFILSSLLRKLSGRLRTLYLWEIG
jgi:hypothetical protein